MFSKCLVVVVFWLLIRLLKDVAKYSINILQYNMERGWLYIDRHKYYHIIPESKILHSQSFLGPECSCCNEEAIFCSGEQKWKYTFACADAKCFVFILIKTVLMTEGMSLGSQTCDVCMHMKCPSTKKASWITKVWKQFY